MLEEPDEQPACQELLEQLVGAVLAPQPDYPRGKGSNMLAYDQFGDLGGTSKASAARVRGDRGLISRQ